MLFVRLLSIFVEFLSVILQICCILPFYCDTDSYQENMAPTGEEDQSLVFGADRCHHRTEHVIERDHVEKGRLESRFRSAPAPLLLGQAKGTAEESSVVAHRTVQAVSCSQEVAVE